MSIQTGNGIYEYYAMCMMCGMCIPGYHIMEPLCAANSEISME